MKKILIICLLLTAASFAQVNFEIYTGANFPIGNKPFSNFLSINYYPGINLGVSADYSIFNIFAVSPFAEYSYFFFKNYNSGTPGFQGNLVSASGTNSQFYRLGLNLKYFPSFLSLSHGYVLTGFSWNGVNAGSININWYDPGKGTTRTSEQIDNSHYVAQSFGIGLGIAKFRYFMVMIEGVITTDYSDRLLGSVNLGFYF